MKLKRWVQYLLLVIASLSLCKMLLTDLEQNMLPSIVYGTIFVALVGIVCDYGTIFQDLEYKLKRF